MEWLIGLIPLPYVAACLLLTILLSYPGLALVFYLDGGSPILFRSRAIRWSS